MARPKKTTSAEMARRLLSQVSSKMKKRDAISAGVPAAHESKSSTADAALNSILRLAYRRHSRGRVAREAAAACLGR